MKTLRILHVGNHALPCIGGVESTLWESAKIQAKMGHTVSILVFDTCTQGTQKLPAYEEKQGVKIYRIPQHGPRFYRTPSLSALSERVQQNDIIHVHGFGPWLDALIWIRNQYAGKIVVNSHGGFFHTKERKVLKTIYTKIWLPLIWKKISMIIFDSEQDKQKFSHLPSENAIVLPNGINLERFNAFPLSKKNQNQLFFLSRLSKNKRVDRLLDAFALVAQKRPKTHLHIAGEDWEGLLSPLKEKATQLGIEKQVTWYGKTSDETIDQLYTKSGIFISASEYEGFGITAIESLAAGCIPLFNNIPTFREFVENDPRFLADFSLPEQTAQSLEELLDLPAAKRTVLRKHFRSLTQKFSIQKVVERQIQAYYQALK